MQSRDKDLSDVGLGSHSLHYSITLVLLFVGTHNVQCSIVRNQACVTKLSPSFISYSLFIVFGQNKLLKIED